MQSLEDTLRSLKAQRQQLDVAIEAIEKAITIVGGGAAPTKAAKKTKTRKRKPMSEEAKARIREAQQKRWAKAKGEGAKA